MASANIADAVARMTASVEAEETVQASLLTSYAGLAQLVRDNKTNPAALDALADKIDADAAAMAAAVVANTDAAG
jgi:hypothetical protein